MKTRLLWLLVVISPWATAQQDSLRRPVYVSVDVLQNAQALFPLLTNTGLYRSYVNVEPNLLVALNKPRRYWHLALGYTAFRSNRTQRNILFDNRGLYLKTGLEYIRRRLGLGWAVTGHSWQSSDHFQFTGAYFGDYTGQITDGQQVALGVEGYLRQFVPLGGRFGLRLIERLNVLAPLRPITINTFIPGAGWVTRGTIKIAGGISAQLTFRLQPNSAPRRFALTNRPY